MSKHRRAKVSFLLSTALAVGLIGAPGFAAGDVPAHQGVLAAAAVPSVAETMTAPTAFGFGAPSAVAAAYYEVLLRHTPWAESQYDAVKGYYTFADFNFGVVLGNAVLLTRGEYDAELTGVDKETLRAHTIATIDHFAASNRFAGGTEWGKKMFWDSTTESYFALAAHLLWDQLSPATRANVDLITAGQAAYTVGLGSANDPLSSGWSPNGLTGGFTGDTKLEEMGVYAQSLSPGVAWNPDAPGADQWLKWLGTWSRNEAGLPAADKANPALVGGVPVSDNTAKNIYDTFAVENHESFGPHYQVEMWRTAGRNSIHFLMAGRPVPEPVSKTPNAEQMWATIMSVMSDSGEPLMPMVADRQHLYGRDVIPIAYLAQVQGDRYAARAEQNMADRLLPYQAYGQAPKLAKFSGEAKYEPEARAEIAISYLFHELRAQSDGAAVQPVSKAEFFEKASRTTDFGGTRPGLLAQQSAKAWAGTVDRAGMVKYAWQPLHDDWLFDIGGAATVLLPSVNQTVSKRSAVAYSKAEDGFDATASLLTTSGGRSGMATLPTGSIVYATSGTGTNEGIVRARNFLMPGIPGLDGSREYTTAEGVVTISKPPAPANPPATPTGVSRVDLATFTPTPARYVRMQGIQGNATFGYSLFALEVRNGAGGPDLAANKTASASSEDVANSRQATKAFDGNMSTRWAVTTADRTRKDSWLQVDLGSVTDIDRATLYWESAAGQLYDVQTSVDGLTWTTVSHQTPGFAKVDDFVFNPTNARYVRMQGVVGEPTYGYSLWEFEARNGVDGTNLARQTGSTATASSGVSVGNIRDGNYATRWSVDTAQRTRLDSWVQLDLGAVTQLDRVRLFWEAATAAALKIQVSTDGQTWTDVANRGLNSAVSSAGDWLAVDGRAGFVVRNSSNPIAVVPGPDFDQIILSAGPATGAATMVVEGYAGSDATAIEAAAERIAPVVSTPSVAASDADGYLSLFELSGADAEATVSLSRAGTTASLYQGTQTTTSSGTAYTATLSAATSKVLPPRFTITTAAGQPLPSGWTMTVQDGRNLTVTAPESAGGAVQVRQQGTDAEQTVTVPAGESISLSFDTGRPYPLADVAANRTTFPTSPLPIGMLSPTAAVDDNPCTTWTPGPNGRLVVDLGAVIDIANIRLLWSKGVLPGSVIEGSVDGLAYSDLATAVATRDSVTEVNAAARYLAVATNSSGAVSAAKLGEMSITGPNADLATVKAERAFCAADQEASTVVLQTVSAPVQPATTALAVKVLTTSPDRSGEVTAKDGDLTIGTGVIDAQGAGSVTLTEPLAVGDHLLTVHYLGNAETAEASSDPVEFRVHFVDKSAGVFYDEVQWLATHKITKGYADGTFRPGSTLDRGALAAWLYRLANSGASAPACQTAPAADVPVQHQFCGEIAWMYSEGLTTGYADGTFRPGTSVERQQVAVFLYRLTTGTAGGACAGSSPFTDVAAGSAFCQAISWAAANHITNGFADGGFHPVSTAQRQAIAAFIARYGQSDLN